MKLIILILDERDAESVSHTLGENDYDVTHVASTGGFMRRGNCTFLIGVEDDRVDDALVLMRETMSRSEPRGEQRALAFVLNVDQYEQL
jgi:uncharacterized protein YaaQ